MSHHSETTHSQQGSINGCDEDRHRRPRTLTASGQAYYEDNVQSHWLRLNHIQSNLTAEIDIFYKCNKEREAVVSCRENVSHLMSSYIQIFNTFMDYLDRVGTDDSAKEMKNLETICQALRERVQRVILQMDSLIPEEVSIPQGPHNIKSEVSVPQETGELQGTSGVKSVLQESSGHKSLGIKSNSVRSSKKSKRSGGSMSSTSSSFLMRQAAKAEAAKTKLEFAHKQAELQRARARLDEEEQKAVAESIRKKHYLQTEMDVLDASKDKAIADAELKAMENFVEDSGRVSDTSVIDNSDRTSAYVTEVNKLREMGDLPEPKDGMTIQQVKCTESSSTEVKDTVTAKEGEAENTSFAPVNASSKMDPSAPVFIPQSTQFAELTNYMFKKDLMRSRLTRFDDKVQTYPSWKGTFKSVTKDLCFTPAEELDLLVSWLGPSSSVTAKSIKAATLHDPSDGVKRLWTRLDEEYGAPEMVEASLRRRLNDFRRVTNNMKDLYKLSDILMEVAALKSDPQYQYLFSYFDTSVGVKPIVEKLNYNLQTKWISKASKYKAKNNVHFPPFSVFCNFIREQALVLNDPSLTSNGEQQRQKVSSHGPQRDSGPINVKKTGLQNASDEKNPQSALHCPIHGDCNHTLNDCRVFKRKSLNARKQFIRDNKFCFRCCETDKHVYRNCKVVVKCGECGSVKHPSALHNYSPGRIVGADSWKRHFAESADQETVGTKSSVSSSRDNGGEIAGVKSFISSASAAGDHGGENHLSSKCTSVCGTGFVGRSCAKIVLVKVHHVDHPEHSLTLYALLDDQSNCTLAKSDFFDYMEVPNFSVQQYTLASCSGRLRTSGRRASRFVISAMDGSCSMKLPLITECNEIPSDWREIPTPDVIHQHSHLMDLPIPPLDSHAQILMLIGRDAIDAHVVQDQRIGPSNTPFAQKLSLGWVVVGDVCLGRYHKPEVVSVNKTFIIGDSRESILLPCPNHFSLKEDVVRQIGSDIFEKTAQDDKVGLSMEDREFLQIIESDFIRDPEGRWKAPLPFKSLRPRLPNNRSIALKRAYLLDASLRKNLTKKAHMIEFMRGLINSGAMEEAPPLQPDAECWYLPLFGIYHPRKPEKIRGVFDSSVQYNGISLNSVLLSGPNLVNDLISVLMHFRKEKVAFIADVEQMFYRFLVQERHRDYLRFFWYRDNNPDCELTEYRMRVHVFGNRPSPAVATYGLRHVVRNADPEVRNYVNNDFYVDDALASTPSVEEAVTLLKKTQKVLMEEGSIRLHKIASNSPAVLEAFPTDDLEKNLKTLDLCSDELPIQQSLGLAWDLNTDCLIFKSTIPDKPFTKRGVLATVNSLFDPLGFISPIIIHGRILMRDLFQEVDDWDKPLPSECEKEWLDWKESLNSLDKLAIPRMYTPTSFSQAANREVHIFCDASERAIAAVAYLKTVSHTGDVHIGLIMGKAKLAPTWGHTIPRLELCGALLATEVGQIVFEGLNLSPDVGRYYTDSMVVLGYLNNRARRFYNYVSNRVHTILSRSKADQWRFVSTLDNPADLGTRSFTSPEDLADSDWLRGPAHLLLSNDNQKQSFPLVEPDSDKEIRPVVIVKKTSVEETLSTKFDKFSSWEKLVSAFSFFLKVARVRKGKLATTHIQDPDITKDAEKLIIRLAQRASFYDEMALLDKKVPLPHSNPLSELNPYVDSDGILRVGGRLNLAPLPQDQRNPIIIHGKSHIGYLLVTYFHESIKHQGRVLTEGTIRSHGYWLIGAKRTVASILHKCVTCRKLRGRLEHQQMANLPADRVTPGPPFSTVGVDVFGPWNVVARKTRGGIAHSKRWAVMFSCLTSRAVHIEVVDEMTSSAFINALRRFTSIRGPVKEVRSDRGTNFIGALDDVRANAIFIEKGSVGDYLQKSRIKWTFNPPHASHMGGSWERIIGLTRKILDAMLLSHGSKELTHDVLVTFMYEVCAILNCRPICPITYDPDNPIIISPSMLITQKMYMDNLPSHVSSTKEIYHAAWKHVHMLSDTFWKRWREGYLQNLQVRRKWKNVQPNLKIGDVVLLREKELQRGHWPVGLVTNVFESEADKRVRTVQLRVMKDNQAVTYVRPVSEVVLLVVD